MIKRFFTLLIAIVAMGSLLLIAPARAQEITLPPLQTVENTDHLHLLSSQPSATPLKTYSLPLITTASKQQIQIDPPATRLVITTKPGDVSVHCGDSNRNHYRCIAGKPLEIIYDPPQPISYFWAYSEHNEHVALKIDVYELYSP